MLLVDEIKLDLDENNIDVKKAEMMLEKIKARQ